MPGRLLPLVLVLAALGGCASPDYAGGPDGDQPHGLVDPGPDVTIRAVDGRSTGYANFTVKVAPGRRRVLVRLQHPIESEAPQPYDEEELAIEVEDGQRYLVDCEPSDLPPLRAVVRRAP